MAERIQVELVDDIDGSPAQQTVTFALDGVTYEIDLTEQHAQALRSVLARYIDCARSPEQPHTTRQQEREERRNRQVNRQLTEQIRGAARRSRERLSQRAAQAHVEPEVVEEPLLLEAPTPAPENKRAEEKTRVPAVALPQFFSAVD